MVHFLFCVCLGFFPEIFYIFIPCKHVFLCTFEYALKTSYTSFSIWVGVSVLISFVFFLKIGPQLSDKLSYFLIVSWTFYYYVKALDSGTFL